MRVCIHGGTKQIGGTCVEIEASAFKNTFPLHVTKWIDLDQSPKPLQNSKAANGVERGQNHKKETPTEIGASRYCWQLALNTDPPVTKRV